MKQLKKIFFISFIFSFFTPIYSMERDDLQQNITMLVESLNEINQFAVKDAFQQSVETFLKTFLKEGFAYNMLIASAGSEQKKQEHFLKIGSILRDLDRLVYSQIRMTSESFIIQELSTLIKNKIRPTDIHSFFYYDLSPELIKVFKRVIEQDKKLQVEMAETFKGILDAKKENKESSEEEKQLNATFISNYVNYFVDDLYNPLVGGFIGSLHAEFIYNYMEYLPEHLIIRILETFKQFSSTQDPLNARVGNDKNTLLMKAAQLGYAQVVQWLLDNGANAKLKNDKGLTAYNIADNVSQAAPPEKVKDFSDTLDLLRNA